MAKKTPSTLVPSKGQPSASGSVSAQDPREKQETESRKALVADLTTTIHNAKSFWEPVFERMREDMEFAGGKQWGGDAEEVEDDKFQVNFVQRELNQEVSAIFAKNPEVVCERRKRLEYTVWDGSDEQLEQAKAILQQNAPAIAASEQAQQLLQVYAQHQSQQSFLTRDINTPKHIALAKQLVAETPPEVIQAKAVMADYQQGMARKKMLDRISETAELIFARELDNQQPDFETQMKDLLLREKTTGAAFVGVKFQRENESVPAVSATQADFAYRLQQLQQKANEMDRDESGKMDSADAEELKLELLAMAQQVQEGAPNILTEGLVFDFKPSTSIIIDPKCRSLFKFVGADWVAEEFMLSPEQVEAQWGVDVTGEAKTYENGLALDKQTNLNTKAGGKIDDTKRSPGTWPEKGQCCVWIMHHKLNGLKYVICDGVKDFLEEPECPWPAVKGFWTIVALKLTRLEVEENKPKEHITIYGQSTVRLMKPMQEEMNRTQEALREHRKANRPGHICGKDTFDKNDRETLAGRAAHAVIPLSNVPPGGDCTKVLFPIPTIPIDPALYRTDGLMQQVLLVTGMQQANLGQQAADEKATGQAIAEQSRIVGVSSDVDSLNKFLSELAHIGGQMLFAEMSDDTVKQVVGPGAVWAKALGSREVLNEWLYLQIEAGSMGRPNRAMEISNLQQMMPQLIQLAQLKGLPLDPLVKYAGKVMEFDFDMDEWLSQAQPQQQGGQEKGASESISIKLSDLSSEERAQALAMAGIRAGGIPPQPPKPTNQPAPPGAAMPQAMLKKAQNQQ